MVYAIVLILIVFVFCFVSYSCTFLCFPCHVSQPCRDWVFPLQQLSVYIFLCIFVSTGNFYYSALTYTQNISQWITETGVYRQATYFFQQWTCILYVTVTRHTSTNSYSICPRLYNREFHMNYFTQYRCFMCWPTFNLRKQA